MWCRNRQLRHFTDTSCRRCEWSRQWPPSPRPRPTSGGGSRELPTKTETESTRGAARRLDGACVAGSTLRRVPSAVTGSPALGSRLGRWRKRRVRAVFVAWAGDRSEPNRGSGRGTGASGSCRHSGVTMGGGRTTMAAPGQNSWRYSGEAFENVGGAAPGMQRSEEGRSGSLHPRTTHPVG